MDFPLHKVKYWSPFRLDALGLVTLLGAEEVSNAVGALEHSRYTECLPLFGTYLIAANKFTRPIPGFALYNISDGVYVPNLNGWFARWLIANLTQQVTILEWTVEPRNRNLMPAKLVATVIGIIANGVLISMAALQGDFYGVANAIAMALSIMVRLTMVHENRKHLNHMVMAFLGNTLDGKPTPPFLENKDDNKVKIIITAPEDKVVAFRLPRGLIKCIRDDLDVDDYFTKNTTQVHAPSQPIPNSNTRPRREPTDYVHARKGNFDSVSTGSKSLFDTRHTWIYTFARGICWVLFAIHVICIGQSSLINQMLSVTLLVCSTMLTIYRVGTIDSNVGDRLTIAKNDRELRHRAAYRHLDPSQEEQRVMRSYLLLPYKPADTPDDTPDDIRPKLNEWNNDWWGKWNAEMNQAGPVDGIGGK